MYSILLLAVAYKWIFRLTVWIIMLDFVMTMIWLPIGVARTYGFQNADWVFREYYNGTGAVGHVFRFPVREVFSWVSVSAARRMELDAVLPVHVWDHDWI